MDTDAFVNGNAHNVRFGLEGTDDGDMFEKLPARFARMFEHDTVDDGADPVLVYMLEGKPVAWYDMENAVGYVAG